MKRWLRFRGLTLGLAVLLLGWAPASSPASSLGQAQPGAKRVIAGSTVEPNALDLMVGAYAGFSTYESLPVLVNSGLTIVDPQGTARPRLAEEVPSVENGLWQLLPNGRMETTWRIRQGAQWHDGTPFTSADVGFTYQVEEDREVAIFVQSPYRGIESIDTSDPRTVTVHWARPYIYADLAFGYSQDRSLLPLPKHLLERPLNEDKAGFISLPYWSSQFVGTGPYRLREWVAGSHLIVDANDQFVLGRPKIDTIEVRFVSDGNVLVANLLAGTVEVNLGGLNVEQARDVASRLPGAKTDLAFLGAGTAFPQFVNTNPPIVTNLQFRRALLHGSDRQQLADTFAAGLSPVAHTFIYPTDPDYGPVESSIVKYDYDPRRAMQMIEGLGYTRGPDGIFQNANGERLSIELRAGGGYALPTQALAALWHQFGVDAVPFLVPRQLAGDAVYAAEYPAFEVLARGNYRWDLNRVLGSSEAPLPENRYFGGNRGRYMNPDLDALIERYDATIPFDERAQALAPIIHHVTDNVVLLNMYYNVQSVVYAARLRNVYSKHERSTYTWNVHEWEADS